jgi:hypothetical protein
MDRGHDGKDLSCRRSTLSHSRRRMGICGLKGPEYAFSPRRPDDATDVVLSITFGACAVVGFTIIVEEIAG